MNLVVGATGILGGRICSILAERGHRIRALVRDSSNVERVEALRAIGAEIVLGDLKSTRSLEAACQGVDVVFSTATALMSQQPDDSFDRVDRSGQQSLIDAAAGAGVKRFVFVSVLGLPPRFEFAAAKATVERHLTSSGLEYTILQPSCFMDVWFTPHVGFDYEAGHVTVYGDGTHAIGFVLSEDVARVAVDAATDPAARDAVLAVVGPDRLTPFEAIRIFEETAGRPFDVQTVPVADLEAQLAGAATAVEQAFAGLMLRYAAGDPLGLTPLPPTLQPPSFSVRDFARRVVGPRPTATL
jgi:uncharacterized protein YbjT (DUF2867 family)